MKSGTLIAVAVVIKLAATQGFHFLRSVLTYYTVYGGRIRTGSMGSGQ